MTDDLLLEEWKESRSTIGRFDQHIFDLRKYGFTFVTGLLTANGYIITHFQNDSQSVIFAKAAIIANLVLILALQFYENIYIIWQRAAVVRSEAIERSLNLELTSAISYFAKKEKTTYYGFIMYWGLLIAVYALTLYTLNSHKLFLIGLFLVMIVSQALIYYFLHYRKKKFGGVDWEIDKITVAPGESVQIKATNLSREIRSFSKKPFQIEDQSGKVIFEGVSDGSMTLKQNESRTWFWQVPLKKDQLYRVKINDTKDKDPYLLKGVSVMEKKTSLHQKPSSSTTESLKEKIDDLSKRVQLDH